MYLPPPPLRSLQKASLGRGGGGLGGHDNEIATIFLLFPSWMEEVGVSQDTISRVGGGGDGPKARPDSTSCSEGSGSKLGGKKAWLHH